MQVSIHAPRAGRDAMRLPPISHHPCFNPRAPCGARHVPVNLRNFISSFNPRAPCGARQGAGVVFIAAASFQSTRPVRGATRSSPFSMGTVRVSIHAPRAGRDRAVRDKRLRKLFQSTRPVRGATSSVVWVFFPYLRFNPRAPCGARRVWKIRHEGAIMFQSTRPVRGATPLP